jgi:hypothetical protein
MSRRRPHEEDDGYGKLKLFCQGKCSVRCWVHIRSYSVFLFFLLLTCVVLIGNPGITFGNVKSPLISFMLYAFHIVIRIMET